MGYGPRVPVVVSLNGQDFSEPGSVMFEYHAPFFLQSLEPTYGPSKGGSRVTIKLGDPDVDDPLPFALRDDMAPDVRCRFNRTVVPAVEVHSDSITCLSPATVPAGGVATVDVSINGGLDYTSTGLRFTYLGETAGCSVSPRFGPTHGGSLVTFSSASIMPVANSMAACLIGGVTVPAVENGLGFVRCRTQPVPAPVTVPIEITLNGQDFTTFGLRYHYEWPLSLRSLTPVNGPVEGGTPVAVYGGVFRNESSDLLRCRFGDMESPATYSSAGLIGCRSPPLRCVDEVQTLDMYSLAHVPEVQTISIDADAYVEESFTIRTFSDAPMLPEVQRVETSVATQDEIQTVSAGTYTTYI